MIKRDFCAGLAAVTVTVAVAMLAAPAWAVGTPHFEQLRGFCLVGMEPEADASSASGRSRATVPPALKPTAPRPLIDGKSLFHIRMPGTWE